MTIPNIPIIDKSNWYWFVGGDETKVYSSAVNSYVPLTSVSYLSWLSNGHTPTKIENEAALWSSVNEIISDMLWNGTTFIQPSPTTFSKEQLKDYAASQRFIKEISGVSFGPNNIFINTSRESQAMINSVLGMALNDSTFTTKWKSERGKFVTVNATQIIALAKFVGAFVANCFAAESTVVAAIDAGTITTKNQVDVIIAAVS